jgi:phosphatidylglycerol lysyltransferase
MKSSGPVRLLGILLVVAVFAAAAWLLASEMRRHNLTFDSIWSSLIQIRVSRVVIALAVTFVNYAVILVCYDYLAFRYAKVPISLARVAFAALTSYPVSYNFGAALAGVPLRYRLYSAWGLPLSKIVQLLVILALTFWFGVFFIAGLLFVVTPLHIPKTELKQITDALTQDWHLHEKAVGWFTYLFADSRPFGTLLLTLTALYVGASLLHKGSIKIFRWTLPVPPFRLTIYQIAIAAADMLVAASVLYILLPPLKGPAILRDTGFPTGPAGFLTALEVYLVAYSLVVLSHVPGGWGVLEGVMIALLGLLHLVPSAGENMPKVVAGIIVFRLIYFILPLICAAAMIGWHEFALRRNWIRPLPPGDAGLSNGDSSARCDRSGQSRHEQP